MDIRRPLIVVSHDGSRPADAAFRWALNHARAVSGRLRVVRAWTMKTAPRPSSQTLGYVPPLEDFEAAVVDDLRADCARLAAEVDDVDIECSAVRGPAANKLLEAAADADLLVVGARGLGGFRGLALGSVSDQLVRHSPCPVVVVRDAHTADTDRTLPSE
ncbi:universal stress protein [Nocardioides sp. W7]|uniref:universal stress protein n=1 Tax=Nocardioides sp. W7 TaxID=2931390 RepID=UPI001FD5E18E|nr:universal stress protein [Nocardioides sp. W7]